MDAGMNRVENALQSLIRITETKLDGDDDGQVLERGSRLLAVVQWTVE